MIKNVFGDTELHASKLRTIETYKYTLNLDIMSKYPPHALIGVLLTNILSESIIVSSL